MSSHDSLHVMKQAGHTVWELFGSHPEDLATDTNLQAKRNEPYMFKQACRHVTLHDHAACKCVTLSRPYRRFASTITNIRVLNLYMVPNLVPDLVSNIIKYGTTFGIMFGTGSTAAGSMSDTELSTKHVEPRICYHIYYM